jgi:hypothetical protein
MALSSANKSLRSCGNTYFSNLFQDCNNETARDSAVKLKTAARKLLFTFVFNKNSNREN